MKSNKLYNTLGAIGLSALALVGCSERPSDLTQRDGRTESGYKAKIGVGTVYGQPKPKIVLLEAINKDTLPQKISASDRHGMAHSREINIDGVGEYQIECKSPNSPKYEDTYDLKPSSIYNGKLDFFKGKPWKDLDEAERERVQRANDLINRAIMEIVLRQSK